MIGSSRREFHWSETSLLDEFVTYLAAEDFLV
jgi:hypothetical protein